MLTHTVEVRDRTIYLTDGPRTLVRHCVNEDVLASALDDEWSADGITSIVICFINSAGLSKTVPYASEVSIPWELMEETGYVSVSYVGYAGTERRLVTERFRQPFQVIESGMLPENPMDASPDEMAYLIDLALSAYESENDRALEYAQVLASTVSAANAANDAAAGAAAVISGGIEYSNLSAECRATIAASAALGVEFATAGDLAGALENRIKPAISAGSAANRLTAQDREWAIAQIFG